MFAALKPPSPRAGGTENFIMQLLFVKKLFAIFTSKIQVHFPPTSFLHISLKQIVSFSLFAQIAYSMPLSLLITPRLKWNPYLYR